MFTTQKNLSIYIHWPFCVSKCPYCDFNSYAKKYRDLDEDVLLNTYLNELDYYYKQTKDRVINTVYFGGGTPSIMPMNTLEKILNFIFDNWQVPKNCEITIEGNPDSITREKLQTYKRLGINRFSVGIQSLNDKNLKFLQRPHDSKLARKTIENLQDIYQDKFSFDLIYTLPNQSIKDWENELLDALKYKVRHMSLYQLTIEEGTTFVNYVKAGKFNIAEEDMSLEFFKLTNEIMQDYEIPAYEVSNCASKGFESRHNINYWQSGDWIGIGAGAHGRLTLNDERFAISNPDSPLEWMERVQHNNIDKYSDFVDDAGRIQEKLLMGLRMYQGVKLDSQICKCLDSSKLNILVDEGLVLYNNDNLRVTQNGMLILDSIINYLCNN